MLRSLAGAVAHRAIKSETFDRLKFTLDCAGERTGGHALTYTAFAGCRFRRHFARRHTRARVVAAPAAPTAELTRTRRPAVTLRNTSCGSLMKPIGRQRPAGFHAAGAARGFIPLL